jgi:hypothetical protein
MKFLGAPSSGSVAGTTFSHNRAGQYTRNRRAPVQPVGTGRRAFIRGAFGAASGFWASLSGADQAAWISFAKDHPITDALGQTITLTGQQMFVAVNTQNQNVGLPISSSVPAVTATTAPNATAFSVTSAGVVTVTLDASGSSSDFILVAFSKPMSAGRTFNKTFWQQTVVPGNSIGGATYGPAYVAQFGTLSTGSKVFLKLTPVNEYGWTGVPVSYTAIVG